MEIETLYKDNKKNISKYEKRTNEMMKATTTITTTKTNEISP